MDKTYGEINYDAYCKMRGGVSFDGKPLPVWSEVKPDIQAAWEAAAADVISEYDGRTLGTIV